MTPAHILVEAAERVGLIRLNRPAVKNALSQALMRELAAALDAFDADDAIGAIVVTGGAGIFSAGADIKEMAAMTHARVLKEGFPGPEWDRLARSAKPTLAAVAGPALGGGLELALMCDLILAAEDARFALPEVTLGTLPGLGGTQRLTRAVGKSRAMELCLTGRSMSASEAEAAGLVARVVPTARLLDEAMATAEEIARGSRSAQRLLRQAIAESFESPLALGLAAERRLFQASFANPDRAEGMAAFIAKRPPRFRDR